MAKVTGTIGNGVDTEFVIAAGFNTSSVAARLFDTTRENNEVFAFQLQRQTPNDTSLTLILTPAPVLDSIYYSITDGSEAPDSSPPS
jgi:hypothetical protein